MYNIVNTTPKNVPIKNVLIVDIVNWQDFNVGGGKEMYLPSY